ncbi:MAG: carbohydrate kinase family protein [Oscillospiraceae bacterium]
MFDVTALGEMLIDFTMQGRNQQGQRVFAQNAGGAPANVAAAIAKLGAKTAFIGKAGNDMHGRFLKETLESCGIDNSGFSLSSEYFTTLAFVDVKADGEREFSFARNHGADKMLSEKDIPLELISNSRILHIGSISLTDEPCRSATLYAVKNAKENGVIVSYDPNYRASLWNSESEAVKQMRSMISYADVMKISEEETILLTGESDYEKAADILLEQGVKLAAITLGKTGAYVKNKNGGKIVKGFKNKALDATGAGDAFWGGFLFCLAKSGESPETVTLEDAVYFADFGNAVASVCVEKYGAIPAMPTMEQVKNKMKEERQE